MRYNVISYYHYTHIADPVKLRLDQHYMCLKLGLLGRIYVSSEGINGTLSGIRSSCKEYMEVLKAEKIFSGVDFIVTENDEHAFQKLKVKIKREIVNSGLEHIKPELSDESYLIEPKDLWDVENSVILDVRSNYEHALGKFKGSITLDIENFREFPDKVDEIKSKLGDKNVIVCCTGSIKSVKARLLLKNRGFKNVYQLKGGIMKYGEQTDGRDFLGRCYVFDNRLSVKINRYNPTIISKCLACKAPCDRMINCANPSCNMHTTICEKCGVDLGGACSEKCKQAPNKRRYNAKGYYVKRSNGYSPYAAYMNAKSTYDKANESL